jgi:hypothetical protein
LSPTGSICRCIRSVDQNESDTESELWRDHTQDLSETSICSQPAKPNIKIQSLKNKNSFHEALYNSICGELCVNSTAEMQKKIILQVLWVVDLNQWTDNRHFAISTDWWRQWCDFVNIEFFDPIEFKDQNDNGQSKPLKALFLSDWDITSILDNTLVNIQNGKSCYLNLKLMR